ncbi:MAG: CoA-binding protein [Planctomycetota bacterium]
MPSVAVVGASTNTERYSHQAVLRFAAQGYQVWPVHPSGQTVAGHAGIRTLAELPSQPDVVTMYVNPQVGLAMVDAIATAKPRLVILNPGADGDELASALRARGLHTVEACSLVLLARGDPLTLV